VIAAMGIHTISREIRLPRPIDEIFPFFADASNLGAITPPWLEFRMLTPRPVHMAPGTRIDYRIRLHGLPVRWRTEITAWEPPHRFVDVQLRGPYRVWEHTHEFVADGNGTIVRDRVRYALPLGPVGEWARRLFVARDVERIFEYRQHALARRFGG
jgi:hypothetical protein